MFFQKAKSLEQVWPARRAGTFVAAAGRVAAAVADFDDPRRILETPHRRGREAHEGAANLAGRPDGLPKHRAAAGQAVAAEEAVEHGDVGYPADGVRGIVALDHVKRAAAVGRATLGVAEVEQILRGNARVVALALNVAAEGVDVDEAAAVAYAVTAGARERLARIAQHLPDSNGA